MEEEKRQDIAEKVNLLVTMVHASEEQRQALIDTACFNEIIKGYAIIAARNAEQTAEQTAALIGGLNLAFSECTAAEACKAYTEWFYK